MTEVKLIKLDITNTNEKNDNTKAYESRRSELHMSQDEIKQYQRMVIDNTETWAREQQELRTKLFEEFKTLNIFDTATRKFTCDVSKFKELSPEMKDHALDMAVWANDKKAFKQLLLCGADMHMKRLPGYQPLAIAALNRWTYPAEPLWTYDNEIFVFIMNVISKYYDPIDIRTMLCAAANRKNVGAYMFLKKHYPDNDFFHHETWRRTREMFCEDFPECK